MSFEEVKDRIRKIESEFKGQSFAVDSQYSEYAYLLKISKGRLSITIRDGYFTDGNVNARPVELTSFEVFFTVNNERFAHYVSDYPLDEYGQRLDEVIELVHIFFRERFTISDDRFLIFMKRRYLNIRSAGVEYHFLQVPQTESTSST